jgi:hypothetical protein
MWLHPEDWTEFAKEFPAADAWIRERGLVRELQHLRNWEGLRILNAEEKDRLKELEALPHLVAQA